MLTSKSLALTVAALALCGSACFPGDNDPTAPVVADLVCDHADVGDGYLLQVTGSFTPGDVAALTTGRDGQDDELRRMGFRGGHFSYWKQVVGHPPFDPPESILCEAMEFASDDGAREFVRKFDPAGATDLPGLLPLPEGETRITEGTPAGSDAADRTFVIQADGEPVDVYVVAAVSARGRFVQTTYAGGQRNDPGSAKQAEVIHSRLLERSLPLVRCETRVTSC